jgi:hypothetical protein
MPKVQTLTHASIPSFQYQITTEQTDVAYILSALLKKRLQITSRRDEVFVSMQFSPLWQHVNQYLNYCRLDFSYA